jgi:hypothetical protein
LRIEAKIKQMKNRADYLKRVGKQKELRFEEWVARSREIKNEKETRKQMVQEFRTTWSQEHGNRSEEWKRGNWKSAEEVRRKSKEIRQQRQEFIQQLMKAW